MGLSRRIAALFRTKVDKALDSAEDPREMLDYSYSQQLELLNKVRRGLADVATSRKRVELQLTEVQDSATKLEAQAQQALSAGREEIARTALTRRAAALSQLSDLQNQRTSLQAEEERLTLASQRLQAKVEAFRTRKEMVKASYTAAEARTRISESVTGISEEMGDIGLAIQRAQDKTAQLEARAGALDELLASGVLEDATQLAGHDELQTQLAEISTQGDIDEQLAQMKRQLEAAPAPSAPSDKPVTDEQAGGRDSP
ncbi:PspA/IM30 family protein [Microtetraspora malaysiensis]|uniref:PspA/IM30 family protein n=1 Tax=Microtetraspora malaysiensis TaxID=161358 RepID=A0ABW6SQI5_9ACTN